MPNTSNFLWTAMPGTTSAVSLQPGAINTVSSLDNAWLDYNWGGTSSEPDNYTDPDENIPEEEPEEETFNEEPEEVPEENISGEEAIEAENQFFAALETTPFDSTPTPVPQPPQSNPIHYTLASNEKAPMADKADKEEFYNKKLSRIVTFKGGRQKGDIGLEIECEGTHLFRTPFRFWSCHEDGSLRSHGEHAPVEYVLKSPIAKAEVRSALSYLDEKLKEAKSKIIHSTRTSVHVHVNCQEMTVRQLYCYLGLYMILEELLVEWSGPERAGNLFCLRAKDSDFYLNMLEAVLKEKNFKSWREEYRYAACNVASIPKFGSLEFRSMKGTVDVEMISTWVDLLWHLKEVSLTYDNPVEIVEEFTSIGPLPFFRKIFPDQKVRALFESVQGMSGKLWDGLRMFRDIAYVSDWKKPLPSEKKSPEQDDQEKVRYKGGDQYLIPGETETRTVHYKTSGEWLVKTDPTGPSYYYRIPSGIVMYYVTMPEYDGNPYFIVDLRDLPVELIGN